GAAAFLAGAAFFSDAAAFLAGAAFFADADFLVAAMLFLLSDRLVFVFVLSSIKRQNQKLGKGSTLSSLFKAEMPCFQRKKQKKSSGG
ncbi:MAG: hypothetical protein J6T08_08035, partial [Lentisphaeria bacterium]|nr:hypothetical protein [Lentisphaeria bacterium]